MNRYGRTACRLAGTMPPSRTFLGGGGGGACGRGLPGCSVLPAVGLARARGLLPASHADPCLNEMGDAGVALGAVDRLRWAAGARGGKPLAERISGPVPPGAPTQPRAAGRCPVSWPLGCGSEQLPAVSRALQKTPDAIHPTPASGTPPFQTPLTELFMCPLTNPGVSVPTPHLTPSSPSSV